MTSFKVAAVMTLGLLATAGHAAISGLIEEKVAREEEQLIFSTPIAGIENKLWFDYRIDIIEAQKELRSDLNRASDIEDLRDAWEEYARELRKERIHYIEEMAERGYRAGTVTVEQTSAVR
ncbi:hypothetical protein [Erythrobacter donghaensis]|uniref:hypothetical protein n=1 Tax=Erythrobacter donghaensis TaxID=267135 RepID=UPI000A37FB7B|nr:hypothetical protein [Erythrobacter donghaensis]